MRLAAVGVLLALVVTACSGLQNPATLDDFPVEPVSGGAYEVGAVPPGYGLCGVTVPSALSLRPDDSATLHVYGDGGLADPYVGALVGVALFDAVALDDLPLGDTEAVTVVGRPARLGGIDGFQLAVLSADLGRVLTWGLDDGRIIQLATRNTDLDLTELAAGVQVDDGVARIGLADLPDGFVDLGNLYELEGRPRFRFSLDYQRTDAGSEDSLTLLGSEGDAVSLEAFRFRASSSERIVVGDRPGVAADIGPGGSGPWVVSWLVEDALILRLFSFRLEPDELARVASSIVPVEGEAWTALIDAHDPPTCRS